MIPPTLSFIFREAVAISRDPRLLHHRSENGKTTHSSSFAAWEPSTYPTCSSLHGGNLLHPYIPALQLSSVSRSRGGSESMKPYWTFTLLQFAVGYRTHTLLVQHGSAMNNSIVVTKNNSSLTRCQHAVFRHVKWG